MRRAARDATIFTVFCRGSKKGPTPSGQRATLVVDQVARDWPNFTKEVVSVHTNQGHEPRAATSQPAAASGAAVASPAKASHSSALDAPSSKAPHATALDAAFAMSLADGLAWGI